MITNILINTLQFHKYPEGLESRFWEECRLLKKKLHCSLYFIILGGDLGICTCILIYYY